MKQVIQSYKNGTVSLRDVPVAVCGQKKILVRNRYSLISIGTERSTIELGKKSILGKAITRPDLVRRAWDKAKKEGLIKTWHEAMGRLDLPTPLGYSSAGLIIESGIEASKFNPGERVACVGYGYASHAEFIAVPVNMAAKIPEGVADEEAAFGMLGVIALHGVRSANLTFGSQVVVLGLGLLGLITVQLLKAYGCDVIAYDPDVKKVEIAKKLGIAKSISSQPDLILLTDISTDRFGADAVIVTAATNTAEPIDLGVKLCRSRAKLVVVGSADIHPSRNELWLKEVELVVSKAGGPGALDPLYELEGIDLPKDYIRWTQNRNLEEFLRLILEKKVDVKSLITHKFSIDEAEAVYEKLINNELDSPIGVLLSYPEESKIERIQLTSTKKVKYNSTNENNEYQLGVIGAGLFGKSLLLPAFKKKKILLKTLVTTSGANVQHSADKFGFEYQATDPNFIWNDPDINAVIGITPHQNHIDLVSSAIKSNKALFLEKPLCITRGELLDIKAMRFEQLKNSTALSAPIIFVGHNRRFSPHTKKIVEWIGDKGTPLVIQMHINAGFIPSTHWVHSNDQGRSRIVGEMSHFVDLLLAIVGHPVESIYAERINHDNDYVVNSDNVVIVFKFRNGSIASLNYTGNGNKKYAREQLVISFDGQTIISEDFVKTKLYKESRCIEFKTRGQEIGYSEEIECFLKCVSSPENLAVTDEEMFHIMDVIFSIEESIAKKNIVNI